MISYIILIVLLLLSFFFSGTETATTAVSSAWLLEQEKQGNNRAKALNKLKRNSELVIGTLLLGNNVVNIAITAIATALLIEIFGEHYGVLIATFGVSFVVLILSEILPKTYALANTNTFALAVAPLLSVLCWIAAPAVRTLNWISKTTMRLLPKAPKTEDADERLKAEIRGAIALQSSEGVLPQEKGMVRNVLDLDEVTVEDIMIHRSKMVSLNIATSMKDLLKFAATIPFSRIPLWKNKSDNIVGILHTKNLLKILAAYVDNPKPRINLQDYCAAPWFVLNTTSLLDQLHAFKKRREHFAIVVDEYGALQGIITLEDVLEEIVGDISDENDKADSASLAFIRTKKGSYLLDGAAPIRDINRHFKWDLPDDKAATLAGLILYEAERIPGIGQTFDIAGFSMTIVDKERHRLTTIEVVPPQPESLDEKES